MHRHRHADEFTVPLTGTLQLRTASVRSCGTGMCTKSPPGDSNPEPFHYKLPICRPIVVGIGDLGR